MNRTEFQLLAQIRIEEAEALQAAGRFDGAYYLAGYAVEFALKACIAKLTTQHEFPPQDTKRTHYVHDFRLLLRTAGLEGPLAAELNQNHLRGVSWAIVVNWSESSRYQFKVQAESASLINAINDPQNGILPWLKQLW